MSTYQIKSGDTLSGIAKNNNIDLNTLLSLNPNIKDPNKIYSGSYINISTPTSAPTQNIASSTNQTAENYAKQESDSYRQLLAGLIMSQQNANQTANQAIEMKKQQAADTLLNKKPEIQKTAEDTARQAYINKMLSTKALSQELSQAGLNTTGTVGTAYSNLENSYGENINTINSNMNTALNEIDRSISDSNTQYDILSTEALSEQEKAALALKQYIEEQVYSRYNDAYSKKTDEVRYAEELKRYYEDVARKEAQTKFENDLAIRQLNASIAKANAANEIFTNGTNNNTTSTNTSTNSGNTNEFAGYNMASIANLGYGPISKKYLEDLIKQGKVIAGQVNGQIVVSKNPLKR